MVTVVSKFLLLVALLGGIENAASKGEKNIPLVSRSVHFSSHSLIVEESETLPSFRSNKSGKVFIEEIDYEPSYKSKKSGKFAKSGSGNSGKNYEKSDSGKNSKSSKIDNYLHVDGDLTVEYEIVENNGSKSSKNGPNAPDFEFIGSENKSWKSTKDERGYGSDGVKSAKYDKDGSDGVKSAKYSKDSESNNKDMKSSKGEVRSVPAPTMKPGSPPPTEEGTFGVGVPAYSLLYNIASKKEPKAEEVNELKEATRTYLDDYFIDEFDSDDFTIYSQFINDIEEFTTSGNVQVVVSYDSIVRFGQLSLIKPMPKQLGSTIEEAFTGQEMIQYEDWLKKMLPNENIFVGSNVQYYKEDGVPDTSRIGVAGIAASAAAITLLVAGVVLYKSKSNDTESDFDKLDKSPGDMTVAGETFAGETFDGAVSVSASSLDYIRRINDEEDGTKIQNLGSIPGTDDADSVNPIWNDAEENEDRGSIFRLAPSKFFSAFRSSTKSAPRTSSDDRFQDNIMPDFSSEDDASQMSDSELSQFVANQTSNGHALEIKSILSQDSVDENTTDDLSVRDNSSRRLRTVAEIEALLSSELKDDNSGSGSRTSRSIIRTQLEMGRPRTVEEIESLLTAEDDDSVVELPVSDEGASIEEC
jgi:hypothetical protein